MQLVKVKSGFFDECKKRGIDKEILYNEACRPGVLLLKMKYKGLNRRKGRENRWERKRLNFNTHQMQE